MNPLPCPFLTSTLAGCSNLSPAEHRATLTPQSLTATPSAWPAFIEILE